ncbi:EpsG family protein [Vibrio parahaemolyticus]|uniref:Putative membrane protein n=1 Tax=Vibrio parahaemolyticus TaxID=670 RepID=A0A5P5X5K9_VIBPH|nr:EpsG family protein [Vibrio parahaemolyticus]QFF90528.1 putative membrane protein [Vibrio parahaemolyticus]
MYPYLVFLFILFFMVLLSIIKPFEHKRKELILLIILLCFVFFLFAFRYNVGADYIAYNVIYDSKDVAHITSWEMGFQALFRVFQSLDLKFYMFSALVLLINILALFIMLYKETKYFLLGAIIYFLSIDGFFSSISFYRQSISVSFFMISMVFLFESKWKRYMIINSIGTLFHVSNIVTIPVVIINFIKLEKISLLVLAPILSYLLGQSGALKEVIIAILNLLGFYVEYVKTDAFSGEAGIGIGFLLQLLLFVILVSSSDICTKKQYKILAINSLYLCLSAISINMLLFYRLAVVFSPIQAIAIPMLIQCSRIKQKKVLVVISMLLYMVLFLRSFYSPIFVRDFAPFEFIGTL